LPCSNSTLGSTKNCCSSWLLLLQYDELANTNRAEVLSPSEMRGRVLVKGKVKRAKPKGKSDMRCEHNLLSSNAVKKSFMSHECPMQMLYFQSPRVHSNHRMRRSQANLLASHPVHFDRLR
jgi:hypothetical protein